MNVNCVLYERVRTVSFMNVYGLCSLWMCPVFFMDVSCLCSFWMCTVFLMSVYCVLHECVLRSLWMCSSWMCTDHVLYEYVLYSLWMCTVFFMNMYCVRYECVLCLWMCTALFMNVYWLCSLWMCTDRGGERYSGISWRLMVFCDIVLTAEPADTISHRSTLSMSSTTVTRSAQRP